MKDYLVFHFGCSVISFFGIRVLMAIIGTFSNPNIIVTKTIIAIDPIISKYDLYLMGCKHIYSKRLDQTLHLSFLPVVEFFSTWLMKGAIIQSILLGPLQILVELYAVVMTTLFAFRGNMQSKENSKISAEMSIILEEMKEAKDEEALLNLLYIFIQDLSIASIGSRQWNYQAGQIVQHFFDSHRSISSTSGGVSLLDSRQI